MRELETPELIKNKRKVQRMNVEKCCCCIPRKAGVIIIGILCCLGIFYEATHFQPIRAVILGATIISFFVMCFLD